MTKQKKLRFSEYYNLQGKFDEMYQASKDGNCFQNLMGLIMCEENIKLAYRSIKRNTGSTTKGVDGLTIRHIEKMTEEQYIALVRNKLARYNPKPVRRVDIPKEGGKLRPLGIPCIVDRLVQQCIYQVLEPICEAKFHERSNGFRPNRSCENAIAQSVFMVNHTGLNFVVDIDIKGFFDNVDHDKLIKQMWAMGIRDKALLSVVRRMLKAPIKLQNSTMVYPEKGTPQGGILSPLLSNIVLNELDWWVASQWETIPMKTQYAFNAGRNKVLKESNLKEMYIVRYADDFKIFCRKRSDADKVFEAVKMWLKERLNLDVSPEKSKVVNLKKQYSDFLGFKIKAVKKSKKFVAKTRMNDKAVRKTTEKLKEQVKAIQHSGDKQADEISKYNSMITGIHNYYNIATHVSEDCQKIGNEIRLVVFNRLRPSKNGEIKNLYMQEHYGKSRMVRYIGGRPLLPIGYVQTKNPMWKKKSICKFTPEGRAEIHKNLKLNMAILHALMEQRTSKESIEFADNKLSLWAAQYGKCAVTGKVLDLIDIHCHHKKPKQLGGTDEYKNLIILHKDVHALIHAVSEETVHKYLKLVNPTKEILVKINRLRQQAGNSKI